VRELVNHNATSIETLYLTESAAQRYPEITQAAQSNSVPVTLATDQVITEISENSQGVLAIAKSSDFAFGNHFNLSESASSLIVMLHNVRDPGNAGTVIRTADAVGADLVILTGDSVEITNPKVIRATVGSLFHLPVIAERNLTSIVAKLKAQNWQVLAAAGSGATQLTDNTLNLKRPTAWIFGNEAWGLSDDDAALADTKVRVPIYGLAESLNLATAAAICLYQTAIAQH
jgi:TrmH family RNA methyltransferase